MSARWGPLEVQGCPVNPVGPLVLTCAAQLRNMSDQTQLVAISAPSGAAAGLWRLGPGESVWVHTPPAGAWRVVVYPATAVVATLDEMTGAGVVIGAALLAGAFLIGQAVGKGGGHHGR